MENNPGRPILLQSWTQGEGEKVPAGKLLAKPHRPRLRPLVSSQLGVRIAIYIRVPFSHLTAD